MKKLILSGVMIITQMASAQSLEEVKQYIEDSTTIEHSDIVIKQAILETGWFQSYNCRARKNLFGFWNSNKKQYFRYNSWKRSIDAYEKWQQKYYKGGDYYEFLECLYVTNKGRCVRYASDPGYISKLQSIKI